MLRAVETELALCTKDIAVEIGNPLPSARRDIKIANRALDMGRNTPPIELGVEIGQIRGRSVPELLVHSDFFKFAKKSIGFAQIMRVAKLADQIGRANEFAFLAVEIPCAGR